MGLAASGTATTRSGSNANRSIAALRTASLGVITIVAMLIAVAALCAGCFSLLILGLAAAAHGDGWPLVLAEWGGALICGVALVWRESGHPAPLLAIDRGPVRAPSPGCESGRSSPRIPPWPLKKAVDAVASHH